MQVFIFCATRRAWWTSVSSVNAIGPLAGGVRSGVRLIGEFFTYPCGWKAMCGRRVFSGGAAPILPMSGAFR
jgi:hypothetical protein